MNVKPFLAIALCISLNSAHSAAPLGSIEKNLDAIEELKSGKRNDANATWWGFDPEDATDAIQAAIKSGAAKVVVPHVGHDWIVRPIQLVGNQELVLEKGVVIVAKRGEYRAKNESVFTAREVDHLTIRGEGATIRMQKEDYITGLVLKDLGWNRWFGQYVKAEWRMCLSIRGCSDVKIEGLTLRDSGGDGIYIDGAKREQWSNRIQIKNVNCDNNYRQGISVISVDGLEIIGSKFNNTWGTPPAAGIDLEPDSPTQRLKNISVRNCEFIDNYGDGIELSLPHLNQDSEPISIEFVDCRVKSRLGPGIRVSKLKDAGVRGSIEFRNCDVDGTEAYGIKVQDKSSSSAQIRFINCKLTDTARNRAYADAWAPIVLLRRDSNGVNQFGGVQFVDCSVQDNWDRPPVSISDALDVAQIAGNLRVQSPYADLAELREKLKGLTLNSNAIDK